MMSPRSVARVLAVAIVCGVPLLLAVLVGAGPLYVLTVPASAVHAAPAVELGIGELEMGPDFGRPAMTPQRGPVATALLYGLLLLCPAKFVLLWVLQRGESREMGTPAGAPASGDA